MPELRDVASVNEATRAMKYEEGTESAGGMQHRENAGMRRNAEGAQKATKMRTQSYAKKEYC